MEDCLTTVRVWGTPYKVFWQDFKSHKRLLVFDTEDTCIGMRDIPIRVDDGIRTVKYLIKRMIKCGPSVQVKNQIQLPQWTKTRVNLSAKNVV